MIKRVILFGALVLASCAAVASFDERAAAFGISALPEGYAIGSKRLQVAALAHAEAGEIEQGKAAARRAITRSPLDQGPLSTLGAIQFENGEAEAAQKSFRAAGALGWRDLATQAYIVEQATQAGDAVVLAQRIDAILRLGTPYERLSDLVRTAETFDTDFSAFPSRLASSPPWIGAYITDAGGMTGPALERRVRMLREGRALGMRLNCRPIGWASQKMVESGNITSGIVLWQDLGCGEKSSTNLGPVAGGFEEPGSSSDATTLLRWNLEQSGDIQATIETAPAQLDGSALHITDTSPGEKRAARRAISLDNASYILKWEEFATTPGADYSVAVECATNGRKLTPKLIAEVRTSGNSTQRELPISPPGEDCNGQIITVSSISGGQRAEFWLDNFVLQPAAEAR